MSDEEKNEENDIEFLEGDEEMADTESACLEKLKKLKARLAKCEAEKQEYLEGWQRSRADYVNLKVSEEKAKHEIGKRAEARLILDFLKVADSFEMAFSNKEAWEKLPDNWRQGVEYIHSQLKSALKDNGVKEINPLHQEFDPQRSHSIGIVETDDEKMDNIVLEVLKIGYELHGQVIRPAQVKVGKYTSN